MSNHVGILAFGSLIDDPGPELEPLIRDRIPARTPFSVEFARSSRKRGGGPTLIPVDVGGSPVDGQVLLLNDQATVSEAVDLLWRRETGKTGIYRPSKNPTRNTVIVERLSPFKEVDTVLYTRIGSNISDLSPLRLAELAIESAKGVAGERREDGVSYLLNAKTAGIVTALMDEYEKAILERSRVDSLSEVVDAIRSQ